MKNASPLRYPGGKWRLAPFFERLMKLNVLQGNEYVEPYAGGASLALSLLIRGAVSRIVINDLDSTIYWFWWAVLHETRRLIRFVESVPLTVPEWRRQRDRYQSGLGNDPFAFASAVFYLNRTNHSGIMNGGVIGGLRQTGKWRINARFNRTDLAARIERVGNLRHRIVVHNSDAELFLGRAPFSQAALVYADPPYVRAGGSLYLNNYALADHRNLRALLGKSEWKWVLSYDDVQEVRRLYRGFRSRRLAMWHSARTARLGSEVLFFADGLRVPRIDNLAKRK